MTTALQACWEVKRILESNLRIEQNTLSGSYTAGGTSLSFSESMRSILEGAELEVDLELFRVKSVSGSTATVVGAQRGTTAADHASGTNVFVNPRFTLSGIVQDLNSTLSELESEGLYREVSVDLTYNPEVSGYDLTGSSTVIEILDANYQDTGPDQRFPRLPFSLRRGMSTTLFPSGNAIVFDRPGFPGLPVRVRYAAPFTDITALTDDLESTVGLRSSAHDLLSLGAAIRNMHGRDARRSFLESQTDTRRSNEVPPGAAQGSLAYLQRKYERRIGEERMQQVRRYPYLNVR